MCEYIPKQSRCNLKISGICICTIVKVSKKKTLYVFLQIIRGIKICLQLNTDDLTWRSFFKAAGRNAKTKFLLKDFLSLSRISKLVSILQENPIKEQGLKFISFLCFWEFFHLSCYILY